MKLNAPMATRWALIRCTCGCGRLFLHLTGQDGGGLALLPVTTESLRRMVDGAEEAPAERPALAAMLPAGRA